MIFMPHKQTLEYGIIGLGRFGTALAQTLADAGKEVLVLDNNESKIINIRDQIENAFVITSLEKESLEDVGIHNCNIVIVCIGKSIDVSILTTLRVISMGVPRVIAKAFSYEQGIILEKIGAEVIYPEYDMGVRLAKNLIGYNVLESIELKEDVAILEYNLTDKLANKTVEQSDLRKKYGLNIIAIVHDGETITNITPDRTLEENDKIVVIGKKDNLNRFESFIYQ